MRYALTFTTDVNDSWYDLCGDLYDYERERIEERLPANTEIQDVCATCFHKLVDESQ